MNGAPLGAASHPTRRDLTVHLVPIPPGVFHCIGNLSDTPFVLQNYPTEYYNLEDEGRVPFASHPIPSLGRGFDWNLVHRTP